MPELVLMDLNLPTVPGVEAIRRIVEESPHVKVLVLSASAEEADVLEAVKVGASGYLLKSATAAELVDAVVRVRAGEPTFSPSRAVRPGSVVPLIRRNSPRTRAASDGEKVGSPARTRTTASASSAPVALLSR